MLDQFDALDLFFRRSNSGTMTNFCETVGAAARGIKAISQVIVARQLFYSTLCVIQSLSENPGFGISPLRHAPEHLPPALMGR
ncbi:MAG: hypothetical protein ACRD4E_07125 [Bryobacteraceae bacterium]